MSHHRNRGGGRNSPSFSSTEGGYLSSRRDKFVKEKNYWGLSNPQRQYPAQEIPWAENSWRLGDDSGEVSDMLALLLPFPKQRAVALGEEKALGNTEPSGLTLKMQLLWITNMVRIPTPRQNWCHCMLSDWLKNKVSDNSSINNVFTVSRLSLPLKWFSKHQLTK